jgi:prepilin-type N-terminal cleavage/methylation domain-containing protein
LKHARVHPRRHARGVTLLEVVLAVVILGLVTASISSTLAFVFKQERQDDLRLAAAELANRLLLQYLDDESMIKRMRGRPLDYGSSRFRWTVDVERVGMRMKEVEPGSGRPRAQYQDRFELVTARVWLDSDDARGRFARNDQGDAPLVELSRLLDPGAARNFDAMTRMGKDPGRLMDLVVRMGITQQGGAPAPGGGGGGGRK